MMKLLSLKTTYNVNRVFGAIASMALFLSSPVVYAGMQCYDFSGPAVGTTYQLGQTMNARHSDINLQKFQTLNGPSNSNVQQAEVVQSAIAQGEMPPALKLTSIVTQIVPQKPAREITMKYAENVGQTGQHDINFGANGERKVLHGTLGQLNGQVFGNPQNGGKVRVTVTSNPEGNGSYWIRGTLTLTSISPPGPLFPNKGIKMMAIGFASQGIIDDFCITE
jgi:hypothetical protein